MCIQYPYLTARYHILQFKSIFLFFPYSAGKRIQSFILEEETRFFKKNICYLVDIDQADSIKELCEISWKLDQEIQHRKISNDEIESSLKKIVFTAEDQIFVEKYIFSISEDLN